jgi:transposase InsO family protein
MEQRKKFIGVVETGVLSVAEACRRFGVSRKTGYKWLARFELGGIAGLEERSRAPKHTPRALTPAMKQRLLLVRTRYPHWGARKILSWLEKREPSLELPAASTVGDLLKREGLIPPRRRSQHRGASPTGLQEPHSPNDCWGVDFKGDFVVQHRRCYPLTVTDSFSRFLLGCDALDTTAINVARPVFERLFLEYGLPSAIRSDNGCPFASTGLAGLSKLSVWWMRLGIRLERIPPGQPQHNGRHERMHRTLKAEATKPPEATFAAQQRRFDVFRAYFNTERPHEALGNDVPATVYQPSLRQLPSTLPDIEYPSHHLLRRVHPSGCIKWRKREVYVSAALEGEVLSLEEVADDIWALRFCALQLGYVDARSQSPKMLPLS